MLMTKSLNKPRKTHCLITVSIVCLKNVLLKFGIKKRVEHEKSFITSGQGACRRYTCTCSTEKMLKAMPEVMPQKDNFHFQNRINLLAQIQVVFGLWQ